MPNELIVCFELSPAELFQLGALAGRARPDYYAQRVLRDHLRAEAMKQLRRQRNKSRRSKPTAAPAK